MSMNSRHPYGFAFGVVAITTALGLALRGHLATIDVAMLLLLAVVIVATRVPQRPAVLASLLSIAAFDFLFVPPYYTFDVHDAAYLITFAVMLLVTLVTTRLTARIRQQAAEAEVRAQTTAALADLNRALADATTRTELLNAAALHLGRAAGGTAVVCLRAPTLDAGGGDTWPDEREVADPLARLAAMWAYRNGDVAGAGTSHCADADVLVIPLRSTRPIGVALVSSAQDGVPLPPPDRALLLALGERVAAALERAALVEQHQTTRLEVQGERLRTALLSSLSHDLRTPLAGIEGAASSLLQDAPLSSSARRELTETILEESRRMTRLVANLLDMVRVEAGTLAVRKEWQPLEECLGVALLRLDERLREYPVAVDLPPHLPLVPIDEVLIEQVFINLLENAARYCPPGTPITISALERDGQVVVTVADRGPGIPPGSEEAVFRKFYRGPSGPTPGGRRGSKAGAGLGLTICRGIVSAHGGRMWVEPVDGGGAAFRFSLPLQGPTLPAAPAERSEPAAAAPVGNG
jgi:two-component system sensor histidine kinase KdpD